MALRCFTVVLSLVVLLQFRGAHSAGFQSVTCGSVLKLANVETSVRLHSHDVKYGSGSGQQSVTGVTHADDVNSYWVVRGKFDEACDRGEPVKCGSTLRLQHLNTRLFLHSHGHRSPLSHNQEVSCFGPGDRGDNWVVECNTEFWQRDATIRLKHTDTNMYLHVSGHAYGRPIAGQKEVSGYSSKAQGNLWKAMEGVYMDSESKML